MTKKRSKKISKKRGTLRNKTQAGGSQELINAIGNDDNDKVNTILETGVDVNYTNVFGITPLLWAAYHGKLEYVRSLLAHGAIVNIPNSNNSPLYEAASRGHIEVVKELLNRGADPTWVDRYERGLIRLVNTETGNQEMVKLLISKGILNGYTSDHAERDGVLEQYQQQIDMERRVVLSFAEKYDLPGDVVNYEIFPFISLEPTQPGGKRKTKKSKAKKGSKKRVSRRNKNKK